jgi:hypothetical protein
MKYFSKRLDEIFEQGMPTKAQILDAFNKGVKLAIAERMPTDDEIEKVALHSFHKSTYYQAVKDAINWFRSRMEEKK